MTDSAIRLAQRRDVPAIVALEEACFARREERYRAIVVHGIVARRGAIALVAPGAGVCAAWAGGIVRVGRGVVVGRIAAVAVHPDERGRGHGARILSELLERLERAGATRLALEVRADNHPARRLYAQHGFVETERLADWYAPGLHAVRMGRG